MKRVSILIAVLVVVLFTMGCSKDKDEKTELELGIEALDNEEVTKAKEHFNEASEEDKNKAKEYLDLIAAAEFIDEAMGDDNIDDAIHTYEEIEEHQEFHRVTFIFIDEGERLAEIVEERKRIDEQLRALIAFFYPEDPPMSANELYLLKSGDLLEQEYVTEEQETAIKDFQDAVNKRIAELAQGSEKETDKSSAEEDTDKGEPEGNTNEGNTGGNNSEQNDDKNKEKDSGVLTHEEAKKSVYEYLYGEGAGDSESEESNFKLELDHEDGDIYVFHYYELVNDGDGGHTATLGWYAVDSKTGEVTDLME